MKLHGPAVTHLSTMVTTMQQCRLGGSAGLRRIVGICLRSPTGLMGTLTLTFLNMKGRILIGNYESYGVLYNRIAMQTWDVCPGGWHIPTDSNISGQGEFWELIAQFVEAVLALS